MGLRGPPPKPTSLAVLEGNPNGKKPNENEPSFPLLVQGLTTPPEHFDDVARRAWQALSDMLTSARMLTEADVPVITRYCELFCEYEKARATVAKGQMLPIKEKVKEEYTDADGRIRERKVDRVIGFTINPAFGIMKDLHRELFRIEKEFGLTPAARTRIAVNNSIANNPNPIMAFLMGGNRTIRND